MGKRTQTDTYRMAQADTHKRRATRLIVLMVAISSIVVLIALTFSAYATFEAQRERLQEDLLFRKHFIEAVGRFDKQYSAQDYSGGAVEATLSQIIDAQARYEHVGKHEEFVLAEKRGNRMHFLLHNRTPIIDRENGNITHGQERSIALSADTAIPMQLATAGQSGSIVAQDYSGTLVLAAYEPISIGNRSFGIVVKVEMKEILQPTIESGLLTLIISIICIAGGCLLFIRMGNPFLDLLQRQLAVTQAVFQSAPNAIIVTKQNQQVFDFNERAADMFELQVGEEPDIQTVLPELYQKTTGAPQTGIHRCKREREHNTTCYAEIAVSSATIDQLDLRVFIISDVTDREEALEQLHTSQISLEAEIAEQTASIQAILDTVVDSIVTIDESGRVINCNQSTETMFGYNKNEMVGHNINILVPQPDRDKHDSYLHRFLTSQKSHIIGIGREVIGERKDGTPIPIHLSVGHAEVNGNHIFVGSMTDFTVQKQVEQELAQAKELAETAAEAKGLFLANMSHEIRTPMNAIIGMTNIVLESTLQESQRHHLETVSRSAQSLLAILNDILDASKIESGQLMIEDIPFVIRESIEDVCAAVQPLIGEHPVQLLIDIDPNLPDILIADAGRLRQILINLISNAIKFTEEGSITVHCSYENKHLFCSVTDTGIGIPDDRQQDIFKRFVQADSSTARKYGGTGLGTYISAQLIEQMGGHIWLKSHIGQGSTFSLKVPCEQSHAPVNKAETIQTDNPPATMQLLLVEDQPANQELMQIRLQQSGHTVTLAENGQEALEILKTDSFDLILMDVHLPIMDGVEVTRHIRQNATFHQQRDIPIIALTASILRSEQDTYMNAGMNAVVGKPIDFIELAQVMNNMCPNTSATPLQTPPSSHLQQTIPGINIDEAADRWGTIEKCLQVLKNFLLEHADDVKILTQAIADKDWPIVINYAHAIRGVASNLSAEPLAHSAAALEQAGKTQDSVTAPIHLHTLNQSFTELQQVWDIFPDEHVEQESTHVVSTRWSKQTYSPFLSALQRGNLTTEQQCQLVGCIRVDSTIELAKKQEYHLNNFEYTIVHDFIVQQMNTEGEK